MDEDDQKPRLDDLRERAGSLWSERAVPAGEDAAWFLRRRIVWPTQDGFDRLGPRGRIGALGGGAVAVGAVVAVLAIGGSGGSGPAATTEAFVAPRQSAPVTSVAPTPKPKKKAAKPTGPTLHGATPDFKAAQDVKAGVGEGKAVERGDKTSGTTATATGEGPVERGSGAGDTPAATAKIGATPAASASAEAQADSLATASSAGAGVAAKGDGSEGTPALSGPPAPKAAKQTARRFAEAFVVYEVGGVDGGVRKAFGQTSTKQLSRSLLRRPPRQPADVKVPQAKVVNVVAGPSRGTVYSVSVSLLRVGVTSELRLELEPGAGKKWQVTNVLG